MIFGVKLKKEQIEWVTKRFFQKAESLDAEENKWAKELRQAEIKLDMFKSSLEPLYEERMYLSNLLLSVHNLECAPGSEDEAIKQEVAKDLRSKETNLFREVSCLQSSISTYKFNVEYAKKNLEEVRSKRKNLYMLSKTIHHE